MTELAVKADSTNFIATSFTRSGLMPLAPSPTRGEGLRALLPCGIDLLAHQEVRVHALTRREFLHAAGIHFGNVEIPFLIDGESVHAPEAAGEIPACAPGIEEVPFQIIFQHLRGAAIISPQSAIGADIEQVNVGRFFAEAPIVEELAVLIEYLHAMIA